jgi:hypothetical protein
MLKLMGRQAIAKLRNRVSSYIREDNCYLQAGTANRYVVFGILVSNPTPWELKIRDIDCTVSHDEIVMTHKALILDSLPIVIRQETASGTLIQIAYDPFSSPIGLPLTQKGWRIRGLLHFSSYFGYFDISVTESLLTKGQLAPENAWSDSVDYVRQNTGKVK